MEKFEVGSRVRDIDGYRATVRYIGPVAASKNAEEVWFGVEWDKSDRGKHDGSCVDSHGVLHRYFNCPSGAGSFVKAVKLSPFKTFSNALHERYVSMDAPELVGPDSKLPDGYFVTSKGRQKSIEFVGEKKIRKWQQLEIVDKIAIRDDSIDCIDDNSDDVLSHLKEIDLQDNLLYKWSEVFKLGVKCPHLETLLLHGNKFEPFTVLQYNIFPRNAFSQLKVLALNSCGIRSWLDVKLLELCLPCLEELYLANNRFPDLSMMENTSSTSNVNATQDALPTVFSTSVAIDRCSFAHLRVLDLSNCEITSWERLASLKDFPNLQELLIDANPISTVLPRSVLNGFAQLQRISLSFSKLASWSDVDNLASYDTIHQLRLTHVPLFQGQGASEVRPKVIARIPSLQMFNGSPINARERLESEKAYLRSILFEIRQQPESNDNGNDDDQSHHSHSHRKNIVALHPRYDYLQQQYGKDLLDFGSSMLSNGSTTGLAGSLSLAADMIDVKFRCMTFSPLLSQQDGAPILKKIPSSMTIARLKMVVKQLFGIPPQLQLLSMQIYKDGMPTFLDDDQASLQYFGAISGAEIYVNEDKSN